MKKKLQSGRMSVRSALSVLMLAICSVCTCAAFAGETSYRLDMSDVKIRMKTITAPDGVQYLHLSAPECYSYGEPGEPMIPYKVIDFLVPTYSNNFKAILNEKVEEGINRIDKPIYPIQREQNIKEFDENLFDTPIRSSYNDSATGSALVVNEFFLNGDRHIVSVAVPTVIYNSREGYYACISSADIKLEYRECAASEMSIQPMSYPESPLDLDISKIAVNVKTEETPKTYVSGSDGYELESTPYYYILTPAYLESSLEDFAAWKRQKGNHVVIKTYEDIYNDAESEAFGDEVAFDPESRVRNWLRWRLMSVGKFNLLLVGDENAGAPIRKFYKDKLYNKDGDLIEENMRYWGDNFYPSDAYFSDLNENITLDLLDNGFYSKRSPLLSFSIPVGRILAHKPEHISSYFRKSLIYELDPGVGDPSYLNNGLAIFQRDMKEDESLFVNIDNLNNVTYLYDEESPEDTFQTNRPTGTEVIQHMKNCGLISVHGHGSPYIIRTAGTGGSYDDQTAWRRNRYIQSINSYDQSIINHNEHEEDNGFDNLDNPYKPSVFYTMSCDVTPFDNILIGETEHHDLSKYRNTYFLGKAFTSAGRFGGPIFIGNTRAGKLVAVDFLERLFGEYINNYYSVGDAMCESANHHTFFYYQAYTRNVRNLIGDPDITIWMGMPSLCNISVDCRDNFLTISGDDLNYSKVVIYNGLNSINRIIVANPPISQIKLDINNIGFDNSDFMLSIFKKNMLPLTYLYANGSVIYNNVKKKYFMTDGLISNKIFSGQSEYSYFVKKDGSVSISATRSLKTDMGFEIGNGGEVTLRAEQSIELNSDLVKTGGSLIVWANRVRLSNGFKVDRGGRLLICNYH